MIVPFSDKTKKELKKPCRGCKREFKSLLDELQKKALQMNCLNCKDEEDKKDLLRRVMGVLF